MVDGIEYTYTICAYDIGLEPFLIDYTLDDSTSTFTSDTLWAATNPDHFLGPSMLDYYDVYGNLIRSVSNPDRGYPYLETRVLPRKIILLQLCLAIRRVIYHFLMRTILRLFFYKIVIILELVFGNISLLIESNYLLINY